MLDLVIRGDESFRSGLRLRFPTCHSKVMTSPEGSVNDGVLVDSSYRILTCLSQYPVFKVQTQRRITLSVVCPAVNPLLPSSFGPDIRSRSIRAPETKNAPAVRRGAR